MLKFLSDFGFNGKELKIEKLQLHNYWDIY